MNQQTKKYGVCDLKYAQKLKELRVKQESLWWWIESFNKKLKFLCIKIGDKYYKSSGQSFDETFLIRNAWSIYSAFTVTELGEMLPYPINFYNKIKEQGYRVAVNTSMWHYIRTGRSENRYNPISVYGNTEANARAKMLIYLIENKLLKG